MANEMNIFARRLRQARIRNKLSMESLSQLVDGSISKQAISKYEAEKMMPSSSTVILLADALKVDVDYFFRPFTFDIQEMNVSFRKKASVGVKETEALKIKIQNEVEAYLEIEEILQIERPAFKKADSGMMRKVEEMEECACKLRKEWKLGIDPISNIQEMLEANGFKVIVTDGPDGFDGVSGMVNDSKPIMVLNKNIHMTERLRFTSLHEAGHLLYNSSLDPSLTPREKEKMCDAFASEMLLPTEVLRKALYGKSKISLKELMFLQESYGISIDAIMHKLRDLGYISQKRYETFHIRKNMNKDLKRMVEESRFKEIRISRFPAMVYSALAQQLITTSKAASLLGCSLTTIRNNVNVI